MRRVGLADQPAHVIPCCALPCARGFTDEQQELLGMVAGRLDFEIRAASDGGAERDK
jgi:hypothetical protein